MNKSTGGVMWATPFTPKLFLEFLDLHTFTPIKVTPKRCGLNPKMEAPDCTDCTDDTNEVYY